MSRENIRLTMSIEFVPEIRIMPIAPPAGVDGAQMVEFIKVNSSLDSLKYQFDKVINLILIGSIHFLGIAVCDDHATCHGTMS